MPPGMLTGTQCRRSLFGDGVLLVFLVAQLCDGAFTYVGVHHFGLGIEANPIVGWYIAVQYRDASGNLSPVYCDDISVEGSP